jgi:hypothetical protein
MTNGPREYTYSRSPQGIIKRNEDGALIPEHEPDNVATKLYLAWLAKGNKPPPGDGPRPNAEWTPPEYRPPPPQPEVSPEFEAQTRSEQPHGDHPHENTHEHPKTR